MATMMAMQGPRYRYGNLAKPTAARVKPCPIPVHDGSGVLSAFCPSRSASMTPPVANASR